MAQVGFYHLTRTGVAQALPQLLGRTLAAGERALVLCRTEATVATLDRALWEVAEPDWLPHGTAADGDADLQPIWLSVEDVAPNGARFLFLTEGAETARFEAFTRVFDLFDGTDEEAVAAARTRWKAVRAGGHEATYWRQGERGWERGG
ncbi:MAG: DNA polymerase III subunit chi [Rhodospirillales bacterium]|nr:DNA polymerase III subunit chi [Rhodospirillales bacterium]